MDVFRWPTAAQNKNIILIDDVTTSGTTFMEAATVLKAGGAKRIIALAVAQA
jgi:predicted amidophosphoribosyltransferase